MLKLIIWRLLFPLTFTILCTATLLMCYACNSKPIRDDFAIVADICWNEHEQV